MSQMECSSSLPSADTGDSLPAHDTDMELCGACGDASTSQIYPLEDEGENPDAHVDNDTTILTDREEFLSEIHTSFLNLVCPFESRIIDQLRGAEVLSSEDEQSIKGENTRRKQARKLWHLLHRIPEEDFAESFVPKLRQVYPHVVKRLGFRAKKDTNVDRCLRHAMKRRINLKRLIDVLPSAKCCSVEDYRRLSSSQYCGEKEWEEVYQLLQLNVTNPQLCSAVEDMLRKKKICFVEHYREIATNGFKCTCAPLETMHFAGNKTDRIEPPVHGHQLDGISSSGPYPSSPGSSKSVSDIASRVDSGIMSVDVVSLQAALFSDVQQFRTKAEKDQYREVKDNINTALTQASHIRTFFRFMEKIRDNVRVLAKQAHDETPSAETRQALQRDLQQAQDYRHQITDFFSQVWTVWFNVQNLEDCFDFALPDDWSRFLMIRHHLLSNEVRECRHFKDKAKDVFLEISLYCEPLPDAE